MTPMSDHHAPSCPECHVELTESDCHCDGIRCHACGHTVLDDCYGDSVETCGRCPIDKRVQGLDVTIGKLHEMPTS